MPYTFQSRVRYSECDTDGLLSIFSMINYLQDCSTFQSEALGLGVRQMEARSRAWLLSAWHVEADRYPRFGEEITVGTFAYGFRGFYGLRRFFIRDGSGAFCVRADSIWFLYDTGRGIPSKSEPELCDPYLRAETGTDFGMLGLPAIERKLAPPTGEPMPEKIPVLREFLDSNKHMNNARYLDLAAAVGEVERPRIIKASYMHEAKLGDMLLPVVERTGEHAEETKVGFYFPDGRVSAVISFLQERS